MPLTELDVPLVGIAWFLPLFEGLGGFVEFTDDEELPECLLSASATPPTMPRLELDIVSLVESRNASSLGRWCTKLLGFDAGAAGTLKPLPTLPALSELRELVSPVEMAICNNVNLYRNVDRFRCMHY